MSATTKFVCTWAGCEVPIDHRPLFGPVRCDEHRPVAGCPRCSAPLVCTLERPGYEFHCIECGSWHGFMAPVSLDPTPEVLERCDANAARFAESRREPTE